MPTRPLVAAAAAALAALAAAPAASAFDKSTITQPGDGAYFVADDLEGPAFQVNGTVTSPGASPDKADLVCERGTSETSNPIAQDVDVSSGAFSIILDPEDLRLGTCRLLMVPDGTNLDTANLSKYSGPHVTTDFRLTFRTAPDDASANLLIDYYYAQQQKGGIFDYDSLNSCGVCDLTLFDPVARRHSEFVFWGNGFIPQVIAAPYNRSGIRIDGRNAWTSYGAASMTVSGASGNGAKEFTGVPELTFVATGTGRGEDLTLTERARFVVCEGSGDLPVSKAGCKSWKDGGVAYERVIKQTREGTLALVQDDFTSTDGAAHAVDVDWREAFRPTAPVQGSYQFPWTGDAYGQYGGGAKVPPPPGDGPFSIFTKTNKDGPDGDFQWPQGLIMFDRAAGEIFWTDSTHFNVPMSLALPASGAAVRVRQAYAGAKSRAELVELQSSAQDRWSPPTVAITSPADGTRTTDREVEVRGTASDDKGVASLTLNGQSLPVAADGTWSGRVALASGANTITAVARDAAGNEASDRRGVFVEEPRVCCAPPPLQDVVAPVLGALSMTNRTFAVARGATAISAGAKRGTRVRYTLSEPATVAFAIARETKGRRVGRKCRRTTAANRRRRPCTRIVRAGRTLIRQSPAGPSALRFTGRIGRRALRPGRHRMAIVASDRAGNRSRPARLRFRIVRP